MDKDILTDREQLETTTDGTMGSDDAPISTEPQIDSVGDAPSDVAEDADEVTVDEISPMEVAPVEIAPVELSPDQQAELLPFDETQLLELAKHEGLVDNLGEEGDVEATPEDELDISVELQAEIMGAMETILFMSDKPVSLPKLRSVINPDVPLATYRTLMSRLREESLRDHRGVEISEVSMGFQLRTKPHMAAVLRKMVKTQPLKITPATMEVLSIVAYKQPATKDDLDRIRGVDCGYVLRALMEKRLVRIVGRSDLPGRPMLYGTTHEFLELFSLKDVKALPPLHEVESMVAASEVGAEEQQAEKFQEFSKMVASSDRILFDDSQIDGELEALRAEIANISTSTPFIEEQKAKERREARIAELAILNLTLDAEDNVIYLNPEQDLTPEALALLSPLPAPPPKKVAVAEPVAEAAAEQPVAEAQGPEIKAEAPETEAPADAIVEAGSLEAGEAAEVAVATPAEVLSDYRPSPELEAAAAEAQWERHSEMLTEAIIESDIAVANAEATATALDQAIERSKALTDGPANAEKGPEVEPSEPSPELL